MRLSHLATIAFCAVTSPALAEDLNSGTFLGRDMDEVRLTLIEMGYEVLDIHADDKKVSDGPITAKVSKDGKVGEIYVSADSGMPTKIEMK